MVIESIQFVLSGTIFKLIFGVLGTMARLTYCFIDLKYDNFTCNKRLITSIFQYEI